MHEFGLMSSILDTVNASAADAGASRVVEIRLTIGEMAQVVEEAMVFALEALSEGPLCEGAKLTIESIKPRSRCPECGVEFEHGFYNRACPECGNPLTDIIAGKEMYIDSIEVDI